MPQKTIFINRYFYPDHSATSQILSDLAFSMAEGGKPLQVVTSRQRYDDAAATLSRKEQIKGVNVRRVWTSRFGRNWLPGRAVDYLSFYLRVMLWLLMHVKRGDTVVAKTDPPLMSVVAACIAHLKGGRLVTWNQDVYPEVATALGISALNGRIGQWLLRCRNWSWRIADTNVVLGRRMQQNLLAQNIPENHIQIVNNWSDGKAIQPVRVGFNPLVDKWALQGKFVVGYSGNMGRAHEFDTILDAAEQLKEHEDILFLFVGHGPKRDEFEEQVGRRQLNNVIFKPYQSKEQLSFSLGLPHVHLISLLPSLEGLIVPSKFYGIAAAGRPTLYIGDADGEIPRILAQHQCGATVSVGDDDGVVAAILAMQKDTAWRQSMGENARQAFDTCFDRPIAMRQWESILYGGDKVEH